MIAVADLPTKGWYYLVDACRACGIPFRSDYPAIVWHAADEHAGMDDATVLRAVQLAARGVGNKRMVCSYCFRRFETPEEARAHYMREHAPAAHVRFPRQTTFDCGVCRQQFHSAAEVDAHSRWHVGEADTDSGTDVDDDLEVGAAAPAAPAASPAAGGAAAGRVTRRKARPKAMPKSPPDWLTRHECPECHHPYNSYSGMAYHIKKNHEGMVYRCTGCEKTFVTKLGAQRHVRVCPRPWDTPRAAKETAPPSQPRKSTAARKKKKTRFACRRCWKSFATRADAKQHIRGCRVAPKSTAARRAVGGDA